VGRLGIATDLRAFGVEEARLDELTNDALAVSRLAKAFPVPDVAARYRSIVANAFAGRLAGAEEGAAQPSATAVTA
jgi:alcohol dehydrogenase